MFTEFHNVQCSKCGATAYSKCPFCRKVHRTDATGQMECLLSYNLKIEESKNKDEVSIIMRKGGLKAEEIIKHMVNVISLMIKEKNNYPSLKQFLCHHDFQFMPGRHSEIGCGH